MKASLLLCATGALVLNLCTPDMTAGYHGCCADAWGRLTMAHPCHDAGQPSSTPALANLHHSCCTFTAQQLQHAPATPLQDTIRSGHPSAAQAVLPTALVIENASMPALNFALACTGPPGRQDILTTHSRLNL